MIMAEWKWRRCFAWRPIFSWKRKQDPIDKIHIYETDHFAGVVKDFSIPDNHRGPAREPADAGDKDSAPAEETPLPIGLAFLQGCGSGTDAFARLSRYGTTNENSYYKASHELQRLQHARRGGYVTPPLAVNLTVSAGADGEPDNAIAALGALEAGAGEGARP